MTDLASVAAIVTAVATSGIAFATLAYARGTMRLANASLQGVEAQTQAARTLAEQNRAIAEAGVRAQVVSSTRLAWMDSVRDNVAELLSLDREIKHAANRTIALQAEFIDNLI